MPEAIVGWKNGRIRLVPPDRRLHLENALRWMNDPEITATIEFNLGVSRKQEEAFFDRIEGPADNEFVWAMLDEAERHVGFISLKRDQLAESERHRRPGDRRTICLGPRLRDRGRPGRHAVRVRPAWSAPDQRAHLQSGDETRL